MSTSRSAAGGRAGDLVVIDLDVRPSLLACNPQGRREPGERRAAAGPARLLRRESRQPRRRPARRRPRGPTVRRDRGAAPLGPARRDRGAPSSREGARRAVGRPLPVAARPRGERARRDARRDPVLHLGEPRSEPHGRLAPPGLSTCDLVLVRFSPGRPGAGSGQNEVGGGKPDGSGRRRQGVPSTVGEMSATHPGAGSSGDGMPATLEQLFVERYAAMVRLAHLLTGSNAVAEDLVQDAFARLQQAWGRVDDPVPYLRATGRQRVPIVAPVTASGGATAPSCRRGRGHGRPRRAELLDAVDRLPLGAAHRARAAVLRGAVGGPDRPGDGLSTRNGEVARAPRTRGAARGDRTMSCRSRDPAAARRSTPAPPRRPHRPTRGRVSAVGSNVVTIDARSC